MSKPLTPEITAWLKQAAAARPGRAQVLCNLLEHVEALERRPIPGFVDLAAPALEPPRRPPARSGGGSMTDKQVYTLCGVILLSASVIAGSPVSAIVSIAFFIGSIASDGDKR